MLFYAPREKGNRSGRYQFDFRKKRYINSASAVIDRVVGSMASAISNLIITLTRGRYGNHADSFGDGLLAHNRAYLNWIEDIKQKYPDLIIENCSSGGMRMDYAMLAAP